ncbi:uncharacterized protein LOC128866598 [Anastrepha ludens]|uniref:uncharacterized protein LOC128866598 n=1 Tax=Anastrepha ludens TaxID=28586 RepID=UPI0023AF368B|nr:uncharacterized protein LOC128866598 [Anastrepha ludens]
MVGKSYISVEFISLATLVLIILSLTDSCMAIKCFKCSVTSEKIILRNVTVFTPMCTKFDESEEFITDCPFSTMCLKTISTLHLQHEMQDTITRGCANQKDTTQVFKNRQWQQEHSVQEVYDEGCIEFKENHLSASGKTYCYCRGDLCNSGPREIYADRVLLMIYFILFSFLFL